MNPYRNGDAGDVRTKRVRTMTSCRTSHDSGCWGDTLVPPNPCAGGPGEPKAASIRCYRHCRIKPRLRKRSTRRWQHTHPVAALSDCPAAALVDDSYLLETRACTSTCTTTCTGRNNSSADAVITFATAGGRCAAAAQQPACPQPRLTAFAPAAEIHAAAQTHPPPDDALLLQLP